MKPNEVLTITFVLLLSGCSAHPLMPYSMGADVLVMAENGCEDPFIDAMTLSPLEATADMLAMPYTMTIWTLRLGAYVVAGIPMALAGKDPKATVSQINWLLPMPMVGPDPDRVDYHMGMALQEGCL